MKREQTNKSNARYELKVPDDVPNYAQTREVAIGLETGNASAMETLAECGRGESGAAARDVTPTSNALLTS